MIEPPDDVVTAAGVVVAEQMKNNPAFTIYDIAAAAIMVERERCAAIAKKHDGDGCGYTMAGQIALEIERVLLP